MKLKEIIVFIILFNSFMFLWSAISMPGMGESSYTSPATYFISFGAGAVFGIITLVAAAAIANYSAIPFPNERSVMYGFLFILFSGTLFSVTSMVTNVLGSIGIKGTFVATVALIVAVMVGLVFLWTVIQWSLSPGESMQ